MKIKELRAKNFALFSDFELIYNNSTTKLIGMNGSGKTTVGLTLLWAGFKGIAEKSKSNQLIGERFRFISEGKKSLDIEIVLYDERTGSEIVLKRHITKAANQITIESGDGVVPDKEYVENLFNVTFLSASHFTALSGKEQALALGIDVGKFDKELAEKKSDAALLRKELKAIGDIVEVEEISKVDIWQLLASRNDQCAFNSLQADLSQQQVTLLDMIREKQRMIKDCECVIDRCVAELEDIKKTIKPMIDIDIIDAQINNSEQVNIRANQYEQYLKEKEKKISVETSLKSNINSQSVISANRLDHIKSNSFGMSGLSIDDDGALVLNNKPIRSPYYSKGELEMIVAQISAGLNPELKIRFIDDFELLDDVNQEKIVKKLTGKGYQIITAEVGDKSKGDGSVLLRECKVVK